MAVILEFNKEIAMEKIRIKDNDMSAGSEILMQMKYHDLKFDDLSRIKKPQQNHKSLYIEEIIRPGTRMPRIRQIFTDPCASASSVQSVFYRISAIIKDHKKRGFLLSSCLNNHREHRGHREKRHRSVLSVYSVVDRLHSDSFSQKKFKNNKPQMKAPRVTPLEGASASTVTPVDCVHTYASTLAYVDGRPQGAQPLTYAPAGAYVSMHGFTPAARRIHVWREPYVSAYCSGRDAGGHDADERGFITLTHRKVREERKAEDQILLCSLRLINYHGIPAAPGNKATVVFQTGFTGSTGW